MQIDLGLASSEFHSGCLSRPAGRLAAGPKAGYVLYPVKMIVPSRPLRVNGGRGAFSEKREECGAAAANENAIPKILLRWQQNRKRRQPTMSPSANDTIRLGFIGVAGRGYGHLDWFGKHPDVQIAAVCDVHQPHLERAIAKTEGKAQGYHDYRKLLENKDIDAVVIATPPHWHAIMAAEAMQAGKDVYCEKPLSRFPGEIRVMVEYAKRYNRITQDGTQVHASPNYHKCVDVVRSGVLGQITAVRNFCAMNDNSEGLDNPPDTDPPAGLDWEMWLGPAPKVPFNIGRFRDGMHRYFKDYVDSWLH